jgi:CheY-like chemotaxis protein
VLVVDDYEPFRRFIRSTLQRAQGLLIVAEALDGLEAVQKSEELQPDLVLLDISLPKLNGIEAARRIRKLSPKIKIIFVSQESSADVLQEALDLGALGYVVKMHAGSELPDAVEAVCQGRRFISSGLSAPDENPSVSLMPRRSELDRSHVVQFYKDDASFLIGFTRFIETALNGGNTVIAIVTESHRNSILQRLGTQGLNIIPAIEHGRFILLDVAQTLSTFMVNGGVDPVRFQKAASDLVAAAAKGAHSRIAACGECAPTLLAKGQGDAAVQLEHLWDEIAITRGVDILCGYVLNGFQREPESHIYERICAEHSAVGSP